MTNDKRMQLAICRKDLADVITQLAQTYDLSYAEIVQLLVQEVSSWTWVELKEANDNDDDK
jgi:hypothetical protein